MKVKFPELSSLILNPTVMQQPGKPKNTENTERNFLNHMTKFIIEPEENQSQDQTKSYLTSGVKHKNYTDNRNEGMLLQDIFGALNY